MTAIAATPRGGAISFQGPKIQFTATTLDGTSTKIAVNLGQPLAGQIITDAGGTSVLQSLRQTSTRRLAVIDPQ